MKLKLSEDQRRILWLLKTRGPLARGAIATELGMHNAAVTRLTRELATLECVEEQPGSITGRGRPIVPLEVSGKAGFAAGAMAHPGWLELVLVDFAGEVIARHEEPFNSPDPRTFIEQVDTRLRQLAGRTALSHSRFLGLGIAIPGAVTTAGPNRRWTVRWLEGWRDVDHPGFFEDVLGLPVWVENEAKLAGLADFHDAGLMRSRSSAIALFVGHGVGGSIVSRRAVLRGEFGNAGDLGRLLPDLTQPRPSGIDLLRELKDAGADITSLREIEACLGTHAGVVGAWVERAGRQLATFAAAGAAWLDPGAIIVSGSLPVPVLSSLSERLRQAEWMFGYTPMPRPSFHASSLGSWATPIGAAMLPIHAVLGNEA